MVALPAPPLAQVWVIYVALPDQLVGSQFREHSVAIEGGIAECSKNVTDNAIQSLYGKHQAAVADCIADDSYIDKTRYMFYLC